MIAGKKKVVALGLAASFGMGAAEAARVVSYLPVSSSYNNFTVLDATGGLLGGDNVTSFAWDGSLFTSSADYTGPGGAFNAVLSSTAPFFSSFWTAHDVQIFGPGSYTFDPSLGGGVSETGTLSMIVGEGQLGAHLLFDWNGGLNTDLAVVWNVNSMFTGPTCLSEGGGGCTSANNPADNSSSTVYMFASTDPDGDGVNGIPAPLGGPLNGYMFNFSIKGELAPVPVPAALWLFGAGLVSLVVTGRKRGRGR